MFKVYLRYSNREGYLLPVLFMKLEDAKRFCDDCARRRAKVVRNLFGYSDPYMQYEVYDWSIRCVTPKMMQEETVPPVYVTEKLEAFNQRVSNV